jgi:hypothetical protein
MNRDINPINWFSNRELGFLPKHFVKSSTPVTGEAYCWVLCKLQGRFTLKYDELSSTNDFILSIENRIYFEDPKELMVYELRWSGAN